MIEAIRTIQVNHTCPVCGSISPCIFTGLENSSAFRYHDCRYCGSTWKEPTARN